MSVDLPLDRMSLGEKIELMERLWADLSFREEDLPSPDWHGDVLRERKQLVDEGKLKFLDWDEAIADLKKEMNADSSS